MVFKDSADASLLVGHLPEARWELFLQGPALPRGSESVDIQLLRFGAHLVLAMRILADTNPACGTLVREARLEVCTHHLIMVMVTKYVAHSCLLQTLQPFASLVLAKYRMHTG